MIDVRRLHVLREVALTGSIAAAARAMGYTPSAVSQQLSALARETGAELLTRRGRGVELTTDALLLIEVAARIDGELEAAEAELAARRAQLGGVVRLLAFATALQTVIPRTVALLAERAPRLQLEIDEADPDDALRQLVQRRADVVVAHDYDLLERRSSADVHRRELTEDDLLLVGRLDEGAAGARASGDADATRAGGTLASAASGRTAGAPIPLAALADRAWVLPDRGSACDRVVERACGAAGFAPRVVARSADFAAVAALADAAGAVALVPQLALERLALAQPPRALAQPVRRRLFAAARTGAQRRPVVAVTLDALAAAAPGGA